MGGDCFIFQGETYEGNVYLATSLSSCADLAFFWQLSPIAYLFNFFLKEPNRQIMYFVRLFSYIIGETHNNTTLLNFSGKESYQNGKISRAKKEVDLFFKLARAK